jgi:hypothetical protein
VDDLKRQLSAQADASSAEAASDTDDTDVPWATDEENASAETTGEETAPTQAIVVRVRADKADQVRTTTIDGQRCLLIPVDSGDSATINGVSREL